MTWGWKIKCGGLKGWSWLSQHEIRLLDYALSCNINHRSHHMSHPHNLQYLLVCFIGGSRNGTVWELFQGQWCEKCGGLGLPCQVSRCGPCSDQRQTLFRDSCQLPRKHLRHRERFEKQWETMLVFSVFFVGPGFGCVWIWRCFEGTWVKLDLIWPYSRSKSLRNWWPEISWSKMYHSKPF